MNGLSVGLVELTSVAAGFAVADAMLKAANVRLLLSRSICSGKFMILVGGDAAAVTSAVESGGTAAGGCLIDSVVMTNLHPDVLEAIGGPGSGEVSGALGIVESFNVSTLVEAADAAVKTASVRLLELRLAMALGGKAIAMLTGDIASVQSAVDAAKRVLSEAGVLVNAVVLARPHPGVYREMV